MTEYVISSKEYASFFYLSAQFLVDTLVGQSGWVTWN